VARDRTRFLLQRLNLSFELLVLLHLAFQKPAGEHRFFSDAGRGEQVGVGEVGQATALLLGTLGPDSSVVQLLNERTNASTAYA